MRRSLVFAVAVCLLGLAPIASAAKATPCSVVPDPVVLGVDTSFTVFATGADPLTLYEVTDQQKQHHKTDEARVWLGYSDELGNISALIGVVDGRISGDGVPQALWPGDVDVKVVRYHVGGGPEYGPMQLLARCGLTVVAA